MEGSRQAYAVSFPPDRYYCLIDELPLHLVPQPARRLWREAPNAGLILNPDCELCDANDLPDEMSSRRDLVSGFALQGTIAWVRDAGGRTMLPFWLTPGLEAVVRELAGNESIPSSIPARTRALLAAAGIIVSADRAIPGSREECVRKAAAEFQEKGYAPLSSLIHPLHVAALRRYYRHKIRTGAIHLGDRQSARRYTAHNESVARFFHHQLTARLSLLAGRALKPSYVYFASYLSGAELKKHTDREQCDFSITFCLDYSPEPGLATPWPICLQTSSGLVTAYQALGDGLAYRGTQLPHFRGILPNAQTSTSIFFHYVSEDFAGSLD